MQKFNKVYETYESWVFIDLWESRNKDGFLIGCGASKIASIADAKTYVGEEGGKSVNMELEGF